MDEHIEADDAWAWRQGQQSGWLSWASREVRPTSRWVSVFVIQVCVKPKGAIWIMRSVVWISPSSPITSLSLLSNSHSPLKSLATIRSPCEIHSWCLTHSWQVPRSIGFRNEDRGTRIATIETEGQGGVLFLNTLFWVRGCEPDENGSENPDGYSNQKIYFKENREKRPFLFACSKLHPSQNYQTPLKANSGRPVP